MKERFKNITVKLFAFIILICSTLNICNPKEIHASESYDSVLMKKISKSYTKKFCNSIGFGLSKESAMNFSIKENNEVFRKRKGFNNLNKDILAEEIATEVVENCGFPINLSGEKGITEFKSYYLSKDQESSKTN